MGRNFWRYQLILFLLFLVWGGFFTAGSVLNQIGFNFAVFYPVALYAGYRKESHGVRDIYVAAVVFNLLTYGLAYMSGGSGAIPDMILVGADFVSMFVILGMGLIMGRRMRS